MRPSVLTLLILAAVAPSLIHGGEPLQIDAVAAKGRPSWEFKVLRIESKGPGLVVWTVGGARETVVARDRETQALWALLVELTCEGEGAQGFRAGWFDVWAPPAEQNAKIEIVGFWDGKQESSLGWNWRPLGRTNAMRGYLLFVGPKDLLRRGFTVQLLDHEPISVKPAK
jgi:hypothetical protein